MTGRTRPHREFDLVAMPRLALRLVLSGPHPTRKGNRPQLEKDHGSSRENRVTWRKTRSPLIWRASRRNCRPAFISARHWRRWRRRWALRQAGKDQLALFIGQWAAPFLIIGTYNKLVKQHGIGFERRAAPKSFGRQQVSPAGGTTRQHVLHDMLAYPRVRYFYTPGRSGTDSAHATVLGGKATASRRAAVLPDGRFLRIVLRGREGRRSGAADSTDRSRQGTGDPDVRCSRTTPPRDT